MNPKHKDSFKGFYHLAESHYAEACLKGMEYVDEIMFGMYHPDGGTTGELCMRWYNIGNDPPSARLECFYDSFTALGEVQGVLSQLYDRDDKPVTPQDFKDILLSRGFKDLTKRK